MASIEMPLQMPRGYMMLVLPFSQEIDRSCQNLLWIKIRNLRAG
jgi:hypothetical protein